MFDTILDLFDRDRRHRGGGKRSTSGLGALLDRLSDHDRQDERLRDRDDRDRRYDRGVDRHHGNERDASRHHRRREFDLDDD